MGFREALDRVLQHDLPNRQQLVDLEALHLEAIVEANQYMNLTRILNDEEAAVKHIYDSVAPWLLFKGVERVLDAGTGAGFPGMPLSVVHQNVRWTLAESVGKKARFVEDTVERLGFRNVKLAPQRAESLVQRETFDIVTARAVAPLERLTELFMPAIKKGARLLLFKGPDSASELARLRDTSLVAETVYTYELPLGMGLRSMIEIKQRAALPRRAAAKRL